MTTVNVENIQKLIEVLKTKELKEDKVGKPVEGFSMSQFYYSCGTPACIAGWASFLVDGGKSSNFSDGVVSLASDFIGVDEETGHSLFYPFLSADMFGLKEFDLGIDDDDLKWTDTTVGLEWQLITPAEAIVTLEKLIETGKVDWSHTVSKASCKIYNV